MVTGSQMYAPGSRGQGPAREGLDPDPSRGNDEEQDRRAAPPPSRRQTRTTRDFHPRVSFLGRTAAYPRAPPVPIRTNTKRSGVDQAFRGLVKFSGFMTFAVLFLIGVFIFIQALPCLPPHGSGPSSRTTQR